MRISEKKYKCSQKTNIRNLGDDAMKILVVDDSTTMLRIVKNTLSRLGHTDIVEADNGVTGLARLGEGGIEVILTDWNMPEMDGLTFVKKVREQAQYKNVPILMVTTEGEKSSILEALKAGVNNYVVKPFTPDTLKEKLEALGK